MFGGHSIATVSTYTRITFHLLGLLLRKPTPPIMGRSLFFQRNGDWPRSSPGLDVGTLIPKVVLAASGGTVLGSETREHAVCCTPDRIVFESSRIWVEEFVPLAAKFHPGTARHWCPSSVWLSR